MPTAKEQDHLQYVADVADLPPGERRIIEIGGKSVGVFNVHGEFVAYLNLCPHEFAPVCEGKVRGTTLPTDDPTELRWGREQEILACPWHGWEFDLRTGECLVDRCRLLRYEVRVIDGKVYVAGRKGKGSR